MHLKEMKNIKSHIWLNLLKLTLHNLPRKVSRATEPTLINTCDQLIHLWPKYIEKDTWTGKNGHNRKARVTWKMEK